MTKTFPIFVLCLLLPWGAAAEWVVQPEKVVNGGVAVLRWQGPTPMDVAVARYDDQAFFLDRDKDGLFALIGVDVKQQPGTLPVEIAGIDMAGENHFRALHVEVHDAERQTDYLTLPPEMVTPKDPATLARITDEARALKRVFSKNSGPYIGGRFGLPVKDPISSAFGTRRVLNGKPKAPHSGTDFRSPSGRLVRAPANGRVVYVGDLYYTGRTVVLDHGSGIFSLYAHLLKPLCRVGQALSSGQPVGKVGSTGRSTGAHLHWTIKVRGAKVDPMVLVANYGKERP